MRRCEFIEVINSFDSLIRFCYENDTDMLKDIYTYDDLREEIERDIDEYIVNNYWYDLRDRLNDINDNGIIFVAIQS